MNQKSSIRFDHREIAVIFSLFIFVSLLMFTVGILVGKGLSQAKHDAASTNAQELQTQEKVAANKEPATKSQILGNSITTPDTTVEQAANLKLQQPQEAEDPDLEAKNEKPKKLHLQPQRMDNGMRAGSLLEPSKNSEAARILKNPKIQALIEEESHIKRVPSAMGQIPESFSTGKYSVQVGSYSSEREAKDRVEALKKLGFMHANFSSKQLQLGTGTQPTKEGEAKEETWYRVWLGYYNDYDSANESGRKLQERGEVKHYLVRKTDAAG